MHRFRVGLFTLREELELTVTRLPFPLAAHLKLLCADED
jgi:hypothetical protein